MALYCGKRPKGNKAKSTMPTTKQTRTGNLECGLKRSTPSMPTITKSK